jgi:cell division protein ZapE
MLPARFRDASFDSFQIDAGHPEHGEIGARVAEYARREPAVSRFRKRPAAGSEPRGLFLAGPPGVGKTHLLAAAYRAASEPRLYASFDELAAAAGPLGMPRLIEIVSGHDTICIDEVVLEDPGNILMLVTLLEHMLASGARILATANTRPEAAAGQTGWLRSFERELGSIAAAFSVHHIEGRDRRTIPQTTSARIGCSAKRVLRCSWSDLAALLRDSHPMHDAGWLQRIDAINISGEIRASDDKDATLRFVRFIDRVYDRAVSLIVEDAAPDPEELVAALEGDPRYLWHVARSRSRLFALLGGR